MRASKRTVKASKQTKGGKKCRKCAAHGKNNYLRGLRGSHYKVCEFSSCDCYDCVYVDWFNERSRVTQKEKRSNAKTFQQQSIQAKGATPQERNKEKQGTIVLGSTSDVLFSTDEEKRNQHKHNPAFSIPYMLLPRPTVHEYIRCKATPRPCCCCCHHSETSSHHCETTVTPYPVSMGLFPSYEDAIANCAPEEHSYSQQIPDLPCVFPSAPPLQSYSGKQDASTSTDPITDVTKKAVINTKEYLLTDELLSVVPAIHCACANCMRQYMEYK